MVASLVPRGARVADVGTGGGGLPRLLLSRGIAAHCIATETSLELLGRLSVPRPGLETRVGSGLDPLGAAARSPGLASPALSPERN